MTDYAKVVTYCLYRYNKAKGRKYELLWINLFGLATDVRDGRIKREDLLKAKVQL